MQETEAELAAQRASVAQLNKRLAAIGNADAKALLASSDYLIRKSVWSFGGDGWAYDIGFGGLDHVFALGRDVNILVLDTEVYSNTGGQASKSTFRGAVAKFAAGGKPGRKKDLGMIAMSYGNVFVGQISLGANPMHAIRTIRAAESYRGTSLLICFSHCINWGINMVQGMEIQKQRGRLRLLAAVQLRSARRGPSVQAGQQEAGGHVQGLRLEGGPLRHLGPLEARRNRPGCWSLASRTSTAAISSTSNWPPSTEPWRPKRSRPPPATETASARHARMSGGVGRNCRIRPGGMAIERTRPCSCIAGTCNAPILHREMANCGRQSPDARLVVRPSGRESASLLQFRPIIRTVAGTQPRPRRPTNMAETRRHPRPDDQQRLFQPEMVPLPHGPDGDADACRAVSNESAFAAAVWHIRDADGKTLVDENREFPDHDAALKTLLDWLEQRFPGQPVDAVGHRVVHGGPTYSEPHLVTAELLETLEEIVRLAPEHLPHELKAIDTIRRLFPAMKQVACFDTAFHRHMPEVAQRIPMPRSLWNEGVLRYGFHGLSYEYIMLEAAGDRRRARPPTAAC